MISLHTGEFPLVGPITLAATAQGLCLISLAGPEDARAQLARWYPGWQTLENATPLEEAVRQLHEYLAGDRTAFSVPMALRGTGFQKQVWACLAEIPYGETRSYASVAQAIGRPGAARAVGGAVGANPVCPVVPCHRVVGTSGRLTGFAYGLPLKEKLLRLEAKRAGQEAVAEQTKSG
jgi:O-6-methylguanine DNA methyltransferase